MWFAHQSSAACSVGKLFFPNRLGQAWHRVTHQSEDNCFVKRSGSVMQLMIARKAHKTSA